MKTVNRNLREQRIAAARRSGFVNGMSSVLTGGMHSGKPLPRMLKFKDAGINGDMRTLRNDGQRALRGFGR